VQLLDSINSLFRGLGGENAIQLSVDTVFSYMEKFLKNLKMDELKISMHKIFLHVIKPAQGEATLEYAFGLKVASSKDTEPKNFSFAELESVSFDIWNTKNQHIVSAMKLTDIAQQLCYADDLNMGMEHG
jgi:hypothetical protein